MRFPVGAGGGLSGSRRLVTSVVSESSEEIIMELVSPLLLTLFICFSSPLSAVFLPLLRTSILTRYCGRMNYLLYSSQKLDAKEDYLHK